MTNSADPDKKPTDLDLHCLLRQGMSCSAREGLNLVSNSIHNYKKMNTGLHDISYFRLRLSFCDYLRSVFVRPSSVHTFERLLLRNPFTSFLQTSCGTFCERLTENLYKRSRAVYQNGRHAHIWQKHLKSSSPEPRKHWG